MDLTHAVEASPEVGRPQDREVRAGADGADGDLGVRVGDVGLQYERLIGGVEEQPPGLAGGDVGEREPGVAHRAGRPKGRDRHVVGDLERLRGQVRADVQRESDLDVVEVARAGGLVQQVRHPAVLAVAAQLHRLPDAAPRALLEYAGKALGGVSGDRPIGGVSVVWED